MLWQCQGVCWKNIGPSHQGWAAFDAHPKRMVSWAYCAWAALHAACSWKEVNWWLIYTKNIHEDRRYGCSGALQRRNSCVKPASGLTIYGNMCLPEEKQIVSWSLPRSLLINSEDVSKIWGQIWQSDPRITAVAGHRGLLSLWLLHWFTLRTQP